MFDLIDIIHMQVQSWSKFLCTTRHLHFDRGVLIFFAILTSFPYAHSGINRGLQGFSKSHGLTMKAFTR